MKDSTLRSQCKRVEDVAINFDRTGPDRSRKYTVSTKFFAYATSLSGV